jgi:hypothetical protein
MNPRISNFLSGLSARTKRRMILFALVLFVALWSAGMYARHKIDDDVNFAVTPADFTGGSHAVAIEAALIHREVDVHKWVSNAPFFEPSHYLDNMANFQQGIVYALGRFTISLGDQIGRARGSSQIDPDLDHAVGFLKYSPTVWIFNPKTSLLPTTSSDTQYRSAREALLSYNKRLAAGQAVFDPRSDNLMATLDSISADLGSQSALIEQYLAEKHFWLTESHSDDIFYATKGRMYADYLILRELKTDYAQVIKDRDLTAIWDNALTSFKEGIELRPLIIIDGAPDSQFIPSHLAAQGFFLLRARTNLREISSVLSK